MKNIKWIAGNGQEVQVNHITEESNIADHTVVNKVDEIEIRLGGNVKRFMGFASADIMQMADGKIRIPAELLSEVTTMINNCQNRRAERMAKNSENEKNYINGYNKTKRAIEA